MPSPATDRQVEYIKDLLDIHLPDGDQKANALAMLAEGISKEAAGKWIDRLKSLPRLGPNGAPKPNDNGGTYKRFDGAWHVEFKEVPSDDEDDPKRFGFMANGDLVVPRGSYAIERPDDELNTIHFYKLWIGDRGGWNIRRVIGPDEFPMHKTTQYEVLTEIAKDPRAAANLYGEQIGRCGICGRRLMRTESRNRGIGPICSQMWGWS